MADPIPTSMVRREHLEAITRLDPAQIRAVKRLVKAASTSNLHRERLLVVAIETEALAVPSARNNVIPAWWTAI